MLKEHKQFYNCALCTISILNSKLCYYTISSIYSHLVITYSSHMPNISILKLNQIRMPLLRRTISIYHNAYQRIAAIQKCLYHIFQLHIVLSNIVHTTIYLLFR